MVPFRQLLSFESNSIWNAFQRIGIVLLVFAHMFCCASRDSQRNVKSTTLGYSHPSEEILTIYRTQTSFTNPGDLANLFDGLPESTTAICGLIKMQLIHPMEAAEMPEVFAKDKYPEDGMYPTVSEMLHELKIRDPEGLTMKRDPNDRLLVACYHHGLFLASILRHQDKPVRLRAGFARYYEEQLGLRFSHIICEVWNEDTGQWDIHDPDRNMQNVSKEKFELPYKVWQNYISNQLPNTKYIGSIGESEAVYIHSLLLDMAFVLCNERSYWHTPEFIFTRDFSIESLSANQINVLNQIADLMSDPGKNISQLEEIYKENVFIHTHEREIDEYYERN